MTDTNKLDCMLVSGDKVRGGYVRVRYKGIRYMAHRLAYELCFGFIPDNKRVLHKCDNPACINPEHLFLGTQLDNMRDKVAKNRQFFARGILNGHAKLTEVQVEAIKKDTRKQKEIAVDYDISQQQVSAIKRGRFWKHLN